MTATEGAGWLANVAGYVRARLIIDTEFAHLAAPRRAVPFQWLDGVVDSAATLQSLNDWQLVVDVVGERVGFVVHGAGDQLDAGLRELFRMGGIDNEQEVAPGNFTRDVDADLGGWVSVGEQTISAGWHVRGRLRFDQAEQFAPSTGHWATIGEWVVRHGLLLSQFGFEPMDDGGIAHLSVVLDGSDRRERLLDALELFNNLGVESPRRDVLAAFMNHDVGAIGVHVACSDAGVVEIGLTGTTADVGTTVLLLDDFGATTTERAARIQGMADGLPVAFAALLGQAGEEVRFGYRLPGWASVAESPGW